MLWWTVAALAGAPQASLSASSTLISGPVNAGQTEGFGAEEAAGTTWNPYLSFGLAGTVSNRVGEHGAWSARWGLRRDQRLCDTCGDEDGLQPGNGGGLQALDSEDLTLALSSSELLRTGPVSWTGALTAVVPASRDAFVCNPYYGAAGASAGARVAAGETGLSLTGSARRDLYRFVAAPVGRPACSRGLAGIGSTQTTTGAASPLPWDGTRFAGVNPAWSTAVQAGVSNPHAPLGGPDWLATSLSAGLGAVKRRTDGATTVPTLTGDLTVTPSTTPWVARVPLSAGIGARLDHLDLWLTAANSLPGLMTDPSATARSLPATTATTFTATGRW